ASGLDLDALLAEEDVPKRAGVPLALDRDAVRPHQPIDQGLFTGGARELEVEIEPIGTLPEPEVLGHHDGRIAGGRPKGHFLAFARPTRERIGPGDRMDDPTLGIADDLPDLAVEGTQGDLFDAVLGTPD